MIGGYAENRQVNADWKWPQTQAANEAIRRRCGSCHKGRLELPSSLSDERGISFWRPNWSDPRMKLGRHLMFNLTRPKQSLILLAPLAKEAGGYGSCKAIDPDNPKGKPVTVFADANDEDYRKILATCVAGKQHLDKVKRFDMPGFKPPPQYIREMRRYGVLPQSFDLSKDAIDVYEADRMYWRQSGWTVP